MRAKAWLLLLPLVAGAAMLPSKAAESPPFNVIEALQARLDKGETKLTFTEDGQGYLRSLLAALEVPEESQVLTFTRSSLQFDKISPKTPRAIYFKDDVAVAAVHQGKLLELIVNDKRGGLAFYTLDAAKTDQPRLVEEGNQCAVCHGMVNRYAPGWIVANISATTDGTPVFPDPAKPFDITEQSTPFELRWGGWYVTGTHGAMQHRGNVAAIDPNRPYDLSATDGLNVTDLSNKFDIGQVLKPTSDIVALMVLEHQTGFANRIAAINARFRAGNPADTGEIIDELIAYMTFADEVPLPAPVKGNSGFSAVFAKRGPRDPQGRSLRDFDLQTRLFRYPLSYMIYSTSFESLVPTAKTVVWQRLREVLDGTDRGRTAIAILAATKPDVPADWKR
jgi:hypothetical protein